jgi:predicted secreted protein
VDTAATAMTIASTDQIVQQSFATSSSQSTTRADLATGYNWDLQLGVSLANVSDTYTLAARTVQGTAAPGSTGVAVGNIAFYNLTV